MCIDTIKILALTTQIILPPVVNDITLHLVFLSWLINPAWSARVYDVETTFLSGNLEKPVYMRIPQGLDKFVGN
jgi:Reverse transcriptase (RNA-dependent DNA polymerase)